MPDSFDRPFEPMTWGDGRQMYDLLAGLSVIEASSFVASPTAGLYCAQMGAEVIRVDQIGGGPDFRRWPVTAANDSLYWENLNRAKKSVALDLASRSRSDQDKRRVLLEATAKGRRCLAEAPDMLQEIFADRFAALPAWEQAMLLAGTERLADLLGAGDMDAAPLLDAGAIDRA